jgi:hypothetical protein
VPKTSKDKPQVDIVIADCGEMPADYRPWCPSLAGSTNTLLCPVGFWRLGTEMTRERRNSHSLIYLNTYGRNPTKLRNYEFGIGTYCHSQYCCSKQNRV